MKSREVRDIIAEKYDEYSRKVIERIKSLGPECRLSGDDSGLADVREEFKCQVQTGESFFYDVYEETIRSICRDVIESLTRSELKLLWLWTDAYFDYEGEGFPCTEELIDAVEDELYSAVWQAADNEEIVDTND